MSDILTLKTDLTTYPQPPPPKLPPAGGTYVDPVFGTTILRVTDERDGIDNHTAYSYWHSLNKDCTRILVFCDQTPFVYDFDPVAFKVSNKRAVLLHVASLGGALRTEDATWSGTNPKLIYCHAGLNLLAYDITKSAFTSVRNFAGRLGPAAANIEQMSRSLDDKVFAFTVKDAAWEIIGYAAWDSQSDRIWQYATDALDEVEIDKTGQFLYVGTGKQGAQSVIEARMLDLKSGQFTDLTDGEPDFSPGHHDCGADLLVGVDQTWSNKINARRMSSPHSFTVVLPFGSNWSLGMHISMLADGDKELLVSTFTAPGNTTPALFKDEIFLIATDGSGKVRRVCHHNSVWRTYWDTPRCNISRDGRWGTFTSNQGDPTRRDVYVASIPPVSTPQPPADLKASLLNAAARALGKQPGEVKGIRVLQSLSNVMELDSVTLDSDGVAIITLK